MEEVTEKAPRKERAPREKSARRIRRSPELLMKELNIKMKKLEDRVYKKNNAIVSLIGKVILKKANFDFSDITPSDIEALENGTVKGEEIIKNILDKIR